MKAYHISYKTINDDGQKSKYTYSAFVDAKNLECAVNKIARKYGVKAAVAKYFISVEDYSVIGYL